MGLLLAVQGFAQEPPKLPPPPVSKATPNRLYIRERATLVPTNRPRCDAATNPCPTNAIGTLITWDAGIGPGYPYRWFEFYEVTGFGSSRKWLGSNNAPQWPLWFSNGAIRIVICVAVDRDMVRDSSGKLK